MIMTEWKTYKLGDITIMRNGKKRPNTQGTYPVYGGNGIMDYADCYNAENTIIVGRVGAYCGNVYQCKNKCWVSDNAISVSANELVDDNYLYYLMSSLDFHHHHIGGAQPLITQDIIGGFEIFLPPLEEQRRIAGILGAIDDKIENNRRINDNLEQQAQALYKQWFVDNRSDDWEVGKVSDYYDITIGKTPPRKEKQWFSNNPKDSVWVSISDMGSCGAYISDSSEYLTTKAVDKFNIKVVPNNTVLLSFKLTVGRVAISDGAMTTNEAIAHFNTLNDYLTEYTYLALKAYNFANLGSTSSIATAVNSKIIKSMLWVMPNGNVLRDFHNIVAPIFTQIKNNIRENETLATLRDTLLPKLMNGEVKL